MAEGNPQQMLARGQHGRLTPLLVLQGTNDDNLPSDMADNLVAAWRKAGGEAELKKFEGQIHAFVNREPKSAATHEALQDMVAFIRKRAK
jgi:dipeptidyl aminopeptidase/acylaminoacyl peptidase